MRKKNHLRQNRRDPISGCPGTGSRIMLPFAHVACRSTGLLNRGTVENPGLTAIRKWFYLSKRRLAGNHVNRFAYGGIFSTGGPQGAATFERKWRHLRSGRQGPIQGLMVGFALNEVLPHMPPHTHLVLLAQIEGFQVIPHLPQRVPYAHMVTYVPAALAASSTDTEPGQGRSVSRTTPALARSHSACPWPLHCRLDMAPGHSPSGGSFPADDVS